MKTFLLSCFFILILFSCHKTVSNIDDNTRENCFNYSGENDSINCLGQFCSSDTCHTYFAIWKKLFLARNNMSEEYFNLHITPCATNLFYWNDGVSLGVDYKVKIDWAEIRLYDDFPVKLDSGAFVYYTSGNIPRNVLLTKDQIDTLLNHGAAGSQMFQVASVEHLKYSTRNEAIAAIIQAAGVDTLCNISVHFAYPYQASTGTAFMSASGVLNYKNNNCIFVDLDLVSGKTQLVHSACYINFCFTEGTNISLKNSKTKPIEMVKQGDTILSANSKTLKIENDIVKQIVAVNHQNLIEIVFDDGTRNVNTADHPYYISGKGWCSYKPAETIKKYNLEAKQLLIGDSVFKLQKNKLSKLNIKSISEKPGNYKTYNIIGLGANKTYFANGILVSDEN